MATLRERLDADLREAQKAHDLSTATVLRMLNATIKNKEIEKRAKLGKSGTPEISLEESSKLTEEEIIETIATEAKKRREAVSQFQAGNRQDLAAKEEAELKLLSRYLPAQLSEEEIRQLVQDALAKTGVTNISDLGKVMGVLMPQTKGRADGNIVNKLVKEALANN